MQLELAHLNYGRQLIPVKSTESFPMPTTFDFDNPIECARRVFAFMSAASGGFALKDCRLKIHRGRRTANLTSSGCHVFYAPKDRSKLTIQQALLIDSEAEVYELGNVRSSNVGRGWERTSWWDSKENQEIK